MDKRVINLVLSFCLIIIISYIAITQIKKNAERKENPDEQIYDDGVKRTFVNQDEILDYLEEKNDDEDFECSYEYEDYFLVFYSKQNKDKSSEAIFLKYYRYHYSEDHYNQDGGEDVIVETSGGSENLLRRYEELSLFVTLFDKNSNYALEINKTKENMFPLEGDTEIGYRLAFLFVEALPAPSNLRTSNFMDDE